MKFERQSGLDRRLLVTVIVIGGILSANGRTTAQRAEDEKPDTGTPRETEESEREWTSLFDGRSLGKWRPVSNEFDFKHHGKVEVKEGCLVIPVGAPATGVRWTGEFPKSNYEIALEAKRAQGEDFFCGLTFPVGEKRQTLILGGWGGMVTGLSNIDGFRAIDNETMKVVRYERDRWYKVRVRVSGSKVDVWLDDKLLFDFETKDHELTITEEMEPCAPLGVATWYTTGVLRGMKFRNTLAE